MLLELTVQVVEHDSGFDHAAAVLDIQRKDAIKVFREIDDDAVIDGLAALRGTAAARGNDAAVISRDGQRPQRLFHGAWNHDPCGHDLVERRIGGVAAAVERIEEHIARDLARKTCGQRAVFRRIPWLYGLVSRHSFSLV